jgi:pterin-4a-carbinolamine dehydratase
MTKLEKAYNMIKEVYSNNDERHFQKHFKTLSNFHTFIDTFKDIYNLGFSITFNEEIKNIYKKLGFKVKTHDVVNYKIEV